MKELLVNIAENEVLITLISDIFVIVITALVTLVDVRKIASPAARLGCACLWTVSWVLLATLPLEYCLEMIAEPSRHQGALLAFVALFLFSLLLAVIRFRRLYRQSERLREDIKDQLSFSVKDILYVLIAVVPWLFLHGLRIFLFHNSYSPLSASLIVEQVIVVPLVEEIGFRALLPCLARDDENPLFDFVLFSLVFSFLHPKLFFVIPLSFALYAHFLKNRTKKVLYPFLCHCIQNYMASAYPF
jgi:membrane protease YdiL (CAAX protease family)